MQTDTKMIVQRVKPMRQTVRLLLLLAAIDCIGAATAWGFDKIRIGMGAFSPTNSAIWVAEERGFFRSTALKLRLSLSAAAPRAASMPYLPAIFSSPPRAAAR